MTNGNGNGENRPSKQEFDSVRVSSERATIVGQRTEVDVISEWIWGGRGVVGAEEKFRRVDDTHKRLWLAVLGVLLLSNPYVAAFVFKLWGH